jgi:hypothetical protein
MREKKKSLKYEFMIVIKTLTLSSFTALLVSETNMIGLFLDNSHKSKTIMHTTKLNRSQAATVVHAVLPQKQKIKFFSTKGMYDIGYYFTFVNMCICYI